MPNHKTTPNRTQVQPVYIREAYRLLQKSIIFVESEDVELEDNEEEMDRRVMESHMDALRGAGAVEDVREGTEGGEGGSPLKRGRSEEGGMSYEERMAVEAVIGGAMGAVGAENDPNSGNVGVTSSISGILQEEGPPKKKKSTTHMTAKV
ncbi:hypothetical protein B484DRAFT_167669 [Ochromonadaceae sp. CCMP2298]|nr:hypothetical protein B484DRAFT_167669 [Ochromonadaceae sp. CCMP2298]